MATVRLTFGQVGGRATTGGTLNIMLGSLRSQDVTSSATSAQSTFAALSGEVAQIWCETGVYVTVGASPTASKASGMFVPPSTLAYVALTAGDKVAVIDAV